MWTEDSWRSLRVNEKLCTISRNALQLVADCPAELPQLVAQHRLRGRRFRRLRTL
ncbi:MAG: hypothetical protein GTO03_01925 [Planctomycetales bacterium]|nr:hypothetical protein [Planctomycetales bacterium]